MSIFASYTQYCDDIRKEADGRVSLMGVYPHSAMVDLDGRQGLPKICVYTTLSVMRGQPLETILVVSEWNNKEMQRVEIPADALEDMNLKLTDTAAKNPRIRIVTAMEIHDLEIGEGGWLQTKVLINGSQIEQTSLRLKPSTDDVDLVD